MKKEIRTVNTIAAPIEKIWENLKTGEEVNTWLPIITSCRVEGNQRFCTTESGNLDETILQSDDATKTFQYAIEKQSLFPITNIVGTMSLKSINESFTDLHWDLDFELEDESLFPQIKEGIEGLYKMGAIGLEELTESININ